MPATDAKFVTAVAALEAVTMPGIARRLAFSAVADVAADVASVPTNVRFIDYDLEGGLSPAADLSDIPAAVKSFASAVHASGRQMLFGPTRAIWTSLEQGGRLNEVLASLDVAQVQEQRVLQRQGSAAFEASVKHFHDEFKAASPNLRIFVQLWLGDNSAADMIHEFAATAPLMDMGLVGTHSASKVPDITNVFAGLRR